MKKLLTTLLPLIFLSSCVSYNQEILSFNLSTSEKYSDFGKGKAVQIVVIDSRINNNLLGKKRLGEKVIKIKSDQNITIAAKDKISKDLGQQGFVAVDGGLIDKVLEVHIINLNYNAYREFFVGNSKIDVLLKIVARDVSSGVTYSTKQSLSMDKKHFIMPLITTDEKTINLALQEALNSIFENQKLLEFLKY
jgi:uncharacterized lipoprotein YajG